VSLPRVSEIIPEVVVQIRETLALDDDEPVTAENLLFYDLGFTSLDLLDLLFRLEDHFDIAIPEGTLYGLARGDLAEEDYCVAGVLTARGREQLMALLHDSPAEIFPDRIHAQTLPRYCTVAAFARLVEHKLNEKV